MSEINRRKFLGQAGTLAFGLGLESVWGAPVHHQSYAEELPDMLLAHLAGKLNSLAARWEQERSKLKTAADIEARNRFVREKFATMIHGFPGRNPLSPVVVNILQHDGYRVENIMFQSRSNFWVTGNLYIPSTGSGPFPAIISPCGHYPLGRLEPKYQWVYLNLVKSGFVVLAYDPIGQGERRQYWNPQTRQAEVSDDPIYEHSMPGQLLLLMGEDLTQYRIWDGMRSIDYLLMRPEVDKERIGCAGHSGGGTLTMFISALDERVKCAVINEGGTSHSWPVNLHPDSLIGPSDVEQNLFPAAVYGVDLCDLHVAIAPRPLLALIEDYSPEFDLAAQHIRSRYEQLGVRERFWTEEATDPHAWTVKLRLATTDWFCRWFYNRPGPTSEPEFEAEPPERLYCTPNGSLRYSQQGETIFSMILKKQRQLPPSAKAPATAAELEAFRCELGTEIKNLLHYEKVDHPMAVRMIVTTPRKGYQVEKLEFLSEPGIYIPVWAFVPERKRTSEATILYVSGTGKETEAMESGLLEGLARKGHLVVAVDVRGIGDTTPAHNPHIHGPGGYGHLFNVETAMSYMAWFVDLSLFGMRVQDVVRSVDYVLSRPDSLKKSVRVIGQGMGALWSLYAAALDLRIESTICDGGLLSYRSLTRVDRYLHGANIFIRDSLLRFDLPQVAAAVVDRRLTLLSPVDHMMEPVRLSLARDTYQWTQETYDRATVSDRFLVARHNQELSLADQYLSVLESASV